MSVDSDLSNEDLRACVNSLIDLHSLLKKKRTEVRKYTTTYKQLAEKVKVHAIKHGLKYIDSKGCQLHIYKQTREPSITSDFIASHLKTFFQQQDGDSIDADQKATEAASYLSRQKKDKEKGTEVVKMTIRNHNSTSASLKRKASEPEKPDFITDGCSVDSQVDDMPSMQEQARMLL